MKDKIIREFVNLYDCNIESYEAYYYGSKEIADELLECVLTGNKKATTGLLRDYIEEGDELPKVGDYAVILDSNEYPRCITRVKRVFLTKFKDITEEYAKTEGEGDKSLKYWKDAHRLAFSNFDKEKISLFDEEEMCVCEEFEVVFKK